MAHTRFTISSPGATDVVSYVLGVPGPRGNQGVQGEQGESGDFTDSPNLNSLAGLTLAADRVLYSTAPGVLALAPFTVVGRALVGMTTAISGNTFPIINPDRSASLLTATEYRAAMNVPVLVGANDFTGGTIRFIGSNFHILSAASNNPNLLFVRRDSGLDQVSWTLTGTFEVNAAQGMKIPSLPAVPTVGSAGKIYFDTATGTYRGHDGTEWRTLAYVADAPSSGPVAADSVRVLSAVPAAALVPVSPGTASTLVTRAAANALGLTAWPDGSVGFAGPGGGGQSDYFAANGIGFARSRGSDADPVSGGTAGFTPTGGMPAGQDYFAGGPIWRYAGGLVMVVHAEKWPGGNAALFWSSHHLIRADTAAGPWAYLGEILRPFLPYDATDPPVGVEIGGGTLLEHDGYVYDYFFEYTDYTAGHMSVARVSVAALTADATAGSAAAWAKWDGTGWSGAGLTGVGAPLAGVANLWSSAARDAKTGVITLVTANFASAKAYQSTDGVRFSPGRVLTADAGEIYYPTLVSAPNAGATATVWYTRSATGGFDRWTDADLRTLPLRPPAARATRTGRRGGPVAAVVRY